MARSSVFMRICYNSNIIVQNTDGDAYSINVKSEIPNKTLDNTTRALLLHSIHKKELWRLAYQYAIWLSHITDNRFHCDVP